MKNRDTAIVVNSSYGIPYHVPHIHVNLSARDLAHKIISQPSYSWDTGYSRYDLGEMLLFHDFTSTLTIKICSTDLKSCTYLCKCASVHNGIVLW